MARPPRCMILSETNHVMLRGIGHMDLFYQDCDYRKFLNTLKKYSREDGITINAYCLMNNHVHLLLQAQPENIPCFFKRVGVSYAAYFNGVYEHVGHLFQNRYVSQPITDERYFLNALRYILLNPEPAGIGKWDSYLWSSAHSYLTGLDDGITDTSAAIGLAGSREELRRFIDRNKEDSEKTSETDFREPGKKRRAVTDANAMIILRKIIGVETPTEIQTMDKAERTKILLQLKRRGLTIRQIERLTGLNRNVIQRAK